MGETNARVWVGDSVTSKSRLGGYLDKSAIRDAATTVLHRDVNGIAHVLMGQRGAKAAFMPNKFVFPGGAVDDGDYHIKLHATAAEACVERLSMESASEKVNPLLVAGIRELWEEAGLILGHPSEWDGSIPIDWKSFAAQGFIPSAAGLTFVFRAITPPGRPRRFDARFFLVNADHVKGDLDDFRDASDELSHLQWIAIEDAKNFDLPFITEIVLAEVAQHLRTGIAPKSVPFFKNDDEESLFLRLNS